MRRRAFLAATVLAPSWLRRAFADASLPSAGDKGGDDVLELEPVDTTAGRRGPADVGRALRRARVRGRPLAVIVVPEREAERWQREELIGGYLRRGTAAQLAPLGGADVICATLESRSAAPRTASSHFCRATTTTASPSPLTPERDTDVG